MLPLTHHEPAPAQAREVVRDLGLREPEALDDFPYRQFALPQEAQDAKARGVPEARKYLARSSVSDGAGESWKGEVSGATISALDNISRSEYRVGPSLLPASSSPAGNVYPPGMARYEVRPDADREWVERRSGRLRWCAVRIEAGTSGTAEHPRSEVVEHRVPAMLVRSARLLGGEALSQSGPAAHQRLSTSGFVQASKTSSRGASKVCSSRSPMAALVPSVAMPHPEQIICKLGEADRMLAQGQEVPEVAKALEV